MKPKVVAVVASNRSDSLSEFLAAWTPSPWDEIIIVEDGPKKSFAIEMADVLLHHFSWAEISDDSDVVDPALFSRRDSAIKLYGFWVAVARLRAEVIIALDDDCLPHGSPAEFVSAHIAALAPRPRWVPSIDGFPTRGFPYFDLGIMNGAVANMGLWREVADYDAPQTLALHRSGHLKPHEPGLGNRVMHPQHYWPWCAMNIAFRSQIAPLMYMPKMGEGSPYRRFDDIWCGVILQRCCRHLGLLLSVGDPHIRHARASDPLLNLEKEAPGIRANEDFWKIVETTPMDSSVNSPLACMEAIASHFANTGRQQGAATRNGTLAAFLADESGRIANWCAMFRKAKWQWSSTSED